MASSFEPAADDEGLRLAIGIDFGATSTGAYVKFGGSFSHMADLTISNWPKQAGAHSEDNTYKTPTRLATDGLGKDPSQPVRWGLLASDDEASFRWFKLGLVHHDDIRGDENELRGDIRESDELKEAATLREKHDTSATELTTIYLRSFWNHVVKQIAAYLPKSTSEDDIKRSELHVAIGTPANSKPATVSRLREAAEAAGIPGYRHPQSELYICIEPEAAAVALVEQRLVSQDLTSGDIITVCDCGGGTADAASYEITSTGPFELSECVSGKGRFCGPVLLDGIFRSSIGDKLKQGADAASSVTTADIRRLYSDLWEDRIKADFDGSGAGDWTESIPAHLRARKGNRRGLRSDEKPTVIGFTRGELVARLDPTMDKVVGLVRNQVEAVAQECKRLPKYVIVCGGFSGNKYLRTKLREEFELLNKKFGKGSPVKLEFSQVNDSRRVVALGCATHAFKNGCEDHDLDRPVRRTVGVASRVARLSYGLGSRGSSSPRQLVTKGENVLVAQPPRFPLHWDDFLPRRNGTVAIYVYEAAEAIIQADTMVKVCSLVWSKDGVDDLRAAFQKTPPHLVELAVDCAGDSVDFKVYINGESQSSGATAGFEVRYKMKGSTY